jgi:hypothetical protein
MRHSSLSSGLPAPLAVAVIPLIISIMFIWLAARLLIGVSKGIASFVDGAYNARHAGANSKSYRAGKLVRSLCDNASQKF